MYDDRSRGEGLLSSMASVKFGLGLHHPIHSKGNHRIYWTQNLGAVYGHFNYDELELTDLPEGILIPESRWGVNVEEAVRYTSCLPVADLVSNAFWTYRLLSASQTSLCCTSLMC